MPKQKKKKGQKFHTLTARLDKPESDMIERIGKLNGESQATKIMFKALNDYEHNRKELERCKKVIESYDQVIEQYSTGAENLKLALAAFGVIGGKPIKKKNDKSNLLIDLLD